MLNPESMSRITIAGSKSHLTSVISELHKLNVLHIEDHSKDGIADIGSPHESASSLSESLLKIRSIISILKSVPAKIKYPEKMAPAEINIKLNALSKKIGALQEEIRAHESKIAKNTGIIIELKKLEGLNVPLEAFTEYKSLIYFLGYTRHPDSLRQELEQNNLSFELFMSGKNPELIALFAKTDEKSSITDLLNKKEFTQFNLSILEGLKGNPLNALNNLSKDNDSSVKKLGHLKKEFEGICSENADFIFSAENFLKRELEKAEAPLRFASTKNAFLIRGWAPTDSLKTLIERLKKISKDRLFVHFEQPKAEEDVPVKLKNPKMVSSFEFFTDLYTLPTYKEFDPALFIFLTFPLFFGFMLGDIGYGIAALLLFLLLRKKMPDFRNFFDIMSLASSSTIFFGLLFGEFFGAEEIGNFHLPHVLSRADSLMPLLYIAVAIGVIHVNLGLILGFINEKKSHGLLHAFYAKMGWMILQLGAGLLLAHYAKILPVPSYPGYIVLAASIIMLIKGEGIRGVIELPGIFTNILSYARLMAIALSSVILAMVINERGIALMHEGALSAIAGILILIIGHAFNIALGLMGCFLHSLRLEYVEFFTKFFHGGGKRYSPFGS